MQQVNFDEVLDEILTRDQRYPRDAYCFLREALDFTQKRAAKAGKLPPPRHVTPQELLEGVRDFALDQFGPMTLTVFEAWAIRRGEDIGEIVFLIIDHKLLGRTDNDSIEVFKNGYDFDTAFRQPFLPLSRKTMPAPTPDSKPA